MKQETPGTVEFTIDDERRTLRYTRRFIRRAALVLLLITVLAVALLIYPVREFSRGNMGALPPGLFLLTIGGFVAWAAISGWIHLGLFARSPIVFDRGTGTCAIPRWFRRPLVLALNEIDHVLLRRTRKDAGERHSNAGIDGANLNSMHVIQRDFILLVLRGSPGKYQRLWGSLGLTGGSEPVARKIASLLRRKLERRPAQYFSREPNDPACRPAQSLT